MGDKNLDKSIGGKKGKTSVESKDKRKKPSKTREESLIGKKFKGEMAQVKFLGLMGKFLGF
jgi:hypothetical protein